MALAGGGRFVSLNFRMSKRFLLRRFALCVGAMLAIAPQSPVFGQLALPGAVAPTPEGSVAPSDGGRRRHGGEGGPAIAPKPPSEDSIVGHALHLDGSRSSIEFQRAGAELQVAKLALTGDRLSRSGEACRVEVSETPVKLQARESETGLRRYQLDYAACPFTVEVLDGAILVSNEGKACAIKTADCRADPAGLWGMGSSEFDPKKAGDMLGARARVEITVRNIFKTLYDKNAKEKDLRSQLVREQAGFSSWREEICRAYVGEAEFGYCALRLTEARALALGAQLTKGVKKRGGVETAEESVAPKGKGRRR
jgi:hypothetical protein